MANSVAEIAVRAGEMARKTNMRLAGVVENMSGEIFGVGGGAALADTLRVPLLGTIPLDPALREWGDRGEPLVFADPDAESGVAIRDLAEAIVARRASFKALPVLS